MSLLNPRIRECSPSWWVASLCTKSPSSQTPFAMNFLEPSRNKNYHSSISYLEPKRNLFCQGNTSLWHTFHFLSFLAEEAGKCGVFLMFLETAGLSISFGSSYDFCFWKLYCGEHAHWTKRKPNLYFFLFGLGHATENHGETCVVSETCRWNIQVWGHWR